MRSSPLTEAIRREIRHGRQPKPGPQRQQKVERSTGRDQENPALVEFLPQAPQSPFPPSEPPCSLALLRPRDWPLLHRLKMPVYWAAADGASSAEVVSTQTPEYIGRRRRWGRCRCRRIHGGRQSRTRRGWRQCRRLKWYQRLGASVEGGSGVNAAAGANIGVTDGVNAGLGATMGATPGMGVDGISPTSLTNPRQIYRASPLRGSRRLPPRCNQSDGAHQEALRRRSGQFGSRLPRSSATLLTDRSALAVEVKPRRSHGSGSAEHIIEEDGASRCLYGIDKLAEPASWTPAAFGGRTDEIWDRHGVRPCRRSDSRPSLPPDGA